MFKFIIIAIVITIVNAGNIGLLGTAYSDASAVSSVYNSISHQHNNIHGGEQHNNGQHEAYIAKSPLSVHSVPVAVQQYHSSPTLKFQHSAPAVVQQIHSVPSSSYALHSSAPTLKFQHSAPAVVQQIHSVPSSSYALHSSAPTIKFQHSAPATAVHVQHSAQPILNIHSAPAAASSSSIVHHQSVSPVLKLHSAPSATLVQHSIPSVNLHSAQHLGHDTYSSYGKSVHQSAGDAAVLYSNNKVPVTYAAKDIRYSLAPEVSHVSVEGHGTHYAW